MCASSLRSPRVFVGVQEVAGIMRGITCGLREQGIAADLFLLYEHDFAYEEVENTNPHLVTWRKYMRQLQQTEDENEAEALSLKLFGVGTSLLHDVISSYDVFIFNGWKTLQPKCADLELIQKMGKKIVTVFLGSEARPQWMQGSLRDEPVEKILYATKRLRTKVQYFERYSDYIVSHPSYSQFLTKPFYSLLGVGIPFAPPSVCAAATWPEKPVIVHAPSSPFKGTARIEEAVQTLRAEGHDFTFTSLSKQPNSVVLENLARCTFVVDELYSDSLLAGLSAEAAYFGKPTLVGSLPAPADLQLGMGDTPLPPCEVFHNGDPLPGMRRLLQDGAYARELGARAKAYMNSTWSLAAIGQNLARFVTGDLAGVETCLPQDICYFRGWGLPDDDFRTMVGRYIRAFGTEALFIKDKPQLVKELLRWLGSKPSSCPGGPAGKTRHGTAPGQKGQEPHV